VYWPTGTPSIENDPSAAERAVRARWPPGGSSEICAPATLAPCGSMMRPVTDDDCAEAVEWISTAATTAIIKHSFRICLISAASEKKATECNGLVIRGVLKTS
jgi:hypothetical protein